MNLTSTSTGLLAVLILFGGICKAANTQTPDEPTFASPALAIEALTKLR